ncbi:MAG: hypothetical protein QOG75_3229, partial [Mycobacterium sp.]|nr:hypothetical protein [Mycobacterium sp.]
TLEELFLRHYGVGTDGQRELSGQGVRR